MPFITEGINFLRKLSIYSRLKLEHAIPTTSNKTGIFLSFAQFCASFVNVSIVPSNFSHEISNTESYPSRSRGRVIPSNPIE